MEYEEDDSIIEDSLDSSDGYCEECKWLMEAVRDFEQQRREVEDQRMRDAEASVGKTPEEVVRDEMLFLAKSRKLEYRRNAALDVLAKHQQLEHQ